MRVVCINDCFRVQKGTPDLVKGQIYNVIDEMNLPNGVVQGMRCSPGIYYNLIETGAWYHESLFIPIVESNIDETERKQTPNKQNEKVNQFIHDPINYLLHSNQE